MTTPENMRTLAASIGAEVLGTKPENVVLAVCRSGVNHVFRVEGPTDSVLVRLNAEPHRIDEFRKEQWAMLQAQKQGVDTPEVLALGGRGDVSFQVQSFIKGEHSDGDDCSLWAEIGQVLRKVHGVRESGGGDEFIEATAMFSPESWREYVNYGLGELGPDDPLRAKNLLDEDTSSSLEAAWRALPDVELGLCHGDVSVRNVLVQPNGRLVLLDWGCARAGVVPFADVAHVIGEHDPTASAMEAFFEGYGTSWAKLEAPMAPIALLSAVDLCRWAIDRYPEELPRCLSQAHWALDFYWHHAPWRPKPSGASSDKRSAFSDLSA